MKNKFLIVACLLLGVASVNAQGGGGGGFQRRTVEERVKTIHEKMDSAFKPGAQKLADIDSLFTTYFKAQDKLREEMMSGGERPDPQVMREKMQPLVTERDDKLKKMLTEEQFKKWKDEIEPSMRRPGGPPRQ